MLPSFCRNLLASGFPENSNRETRRRTSGAESALWKTKDFNAALKLLRHPKSEFFRNL
jgi:hypothetical protein